MNTHAATEELFRTHYDRLFGFCMKWTRQNREDSEDLVMRTFSRFLRLPEVRPETAEHLLFRIARQEISRRYKRLSEQPTFKDLPEQLPAEDTWHDLHSTVTAKQLLRLIPPGLARLLELKYVHQLSRARICDRFSMQPFELDERLREARTRLRLAIEREAVTGVH